MFQLGETGIEVEEEEEEDSTQTNGQHRILPSSLESH
jgi:hypothetical protein